MEVLTSGLGSARNSLVQLEIHSSVILALLVVAFFSWRYRRTHWSIPSILFIFFLVSLSVPANLVLGEYPTTVPLALADHRPKFLTAKDIFTNGKHFTDQNNRTLLLRGVNLAGSTKVPTTPDGSTNNPIDSSFFDPAAQSSISFVGRPFDLKDADEHFLRLRTWGFTFIRFLTTWEAIEHSGPGIYDKEYLEYVRDVIRKAAEHGISVFIDPHQDVWSRFTGGDGAPLWTLEYAGFNASNLHETGSAFVHQQHKGDQPKMMWPTNMGKLATATMFTLFFAGNEFAPKTLVNGKNIQYFLQEHYFNALSELAKILKDEPNVIGFDTMNEPSTGFVGVQDLRERMFPVKLGHVVTPWEGFRLANGESFPIDFYESPFKFANSSNIMNPRNLSSWISPEKDVWRQNGVWGIKNGEPVLLEFDYFSHHRDASKSSINFMEDYMVPFFNNFEREIRKNGNKDWIIFVEPHLDSVNPGAHPQGPKNIKFERWVYVPHWYDAIVLGTKSFSRYFGLETVSFLPVFGPEEFVNWGVCRSVSLLIEEENKNVPLIIGEFGISMDLEGGKAFSDGDWRVQALALERSMRCLEKNLASYTLWNYTPQNKNKKGDGWNGEDLSLYSVDQRRQAEFDGRNVYDGGRALPAAIRPSLLRVNGVPIQQRFSPFSVKRDFTATIQRTKNGATGPTVVFVPYYQYPHGYSATFNCTASLKKNATQQSLEIHHTSNQPEFCHLQITAFSNSSSGFSDFYKLSAKTISGEVFNFSSLLGKVVLIVNVASECGFTSQYADLQKLHEKYHSEGLVIIGFPCNQFGGQEPGNTNQIKDFCEKKFGVDFLMMDKVDVNGDETHEVYRFLKRQKTQMLMEMVKWNFEKFLVDRNGKVVERFSSLATPLGIETQIDELLKKKKQKYKISFTMDLPK